MTMMCWSLSRGRLAISQWNLTKSPLFVRAKTLLVAIDDELSRGRIFTSLRTCKTMVFVYGSRFCAIIGYNGLELTRLTFIQSQENFGAWRSLDSASDWGSEGRWFKSSRPDL